MARRKKVTTQALKAIISDGLRNSAGYYGGELQRRREKALEYYLGYPMGNEIEGRSRVISTDVMDTVESMLPSLLKAFTSTNDVVKFEPVGPEDEAAAGVVSDYCNHIFLKDNPGVMLLHEVFKDALLSGFGCLKTQWVEKTDVTTEMYEGLTDEEMVLMLADKEVEAVEHTVNEEQVSLGSDDLSLEAPASRSHDLKIRRKKNTGRVVIESVAPEDLFIERRARTLEEANFVAHRARYTASDLVAMGYKKSVIDNIPSVSDEHLGTEQLLREGLDDSDFGNYQGGEDAHDPSRREIYLYDTYVKVDRNGDGIAEWVRVLAAGSGAYEILDEEEVAEPPFSCLIPIPMPHRFFGMSLADQLFTIQDIKTSLWRNYLDSVYIGNNHRHEVVEGMVNMDDMLNSRPGGIVRVKQPGMVRELQHSPVGPSVLEAMRYADEVKEVRTGVTKNAQGIHQDQLNPNATATGVKLMLGMAQQRIEMIGRIFAEGGVKDVFSKILKCVVMHQQQERMVRIHNQWVPMDPRNWDTQYDVTIQVGLGYGNDEKRALALTNVINAQKELAGNMGFGPGSIVSRQNVYASLTDLTKEGGIDGAKYFTQPAPDGSDMPQPQPDPNQTFMENQLKIEGEKLNVRREEIQAEQARKMQELEAELQMKGQELEMKMAEMNQRLAIEREKIAANIEQTAAKIAADAEAGASKLAVEAEMARERLEHETFEGDKDRLS